MLKVNNIIEECFEYGRLNHYRVELEVPEEVLIPIITANIVRKGNAHKEIAKVYDLDKSKYIEAYKNSAFYENIVYDSEHCDIVVYAKKLAGIYEANRITNDFSDIIKIGKKAFNKIYRNIPNKGPIPVEDIKRNLEKDYTRAEQVLVIIYLLGLENIDVILSSRELSYVENVVDFYEDRVRPNEDLKLTDEEYISCKDGIKYLRDLLGLDKSIKNIGDIIPRAISLDLEKHNKKCDILSEPHKKVYASNDIEEKGLKRSEVYDLMNYMTSYNDLFFKIKLNYMNLFKNMAISQSEIDYLLQNIYMHEETLKNNEELLKMYAISSFFIYGLYKEYKNTRNRYFKECTEEFIVKNEKLEKELLTLTSEAREAKRKYDEKTTLVNNEKKELLKEIERLKKENNRLSKQVENYKEAKKENIKLRNYVFTNSYLVNDEDDESIEDNIDLRVFEGKKIAVLGGSTNWINKMKEVLPNAIYATSETKNSTLDFIDKDTYVFINTAMGHEFYNKIQSITSKLNIDYNYISNPNKRTITNVNKSIRVMEDILKEKAD